VIVISFALPEESKEIVRGLVGARRSGSAALPVIAGTLAGRSVVIVHSGMGMASATATLGSFLEGQSPSLWIAAGFGGGLSADLEVGDIVTVRNFSDPALLEAIEALPTRRGTLITTKSVIETAVQKQDLARHTGAIVVDMETAAIQRLCCPRGIPMLSVRAISDTASQDLPIPAAVWFDPIRQRPRPVPHLLPLPLLPGKSSSPPPSTGSGPSASTGSGPSASTGSGPSAFIIHNS
jgi:adenosylhomocysteine nucleosidase